jgi:hypothetical protein
VAHTFTTLRSALVGGVLLSVLLSPASAATPAFPGEVIEDVIIPVPSEIFLVMDKLGRPDWHAQLRRERSPIVSNRVDSALLLGATVADGFIAVQAQNASAVERIGKDVLRLAEGLGLHETVVPHTNSILESAKKSHWEIVRVELDKTQKTVRDTMEARRDTDLAQCVSLGGWLRGTEAVTALIEKDYSTNAAELLNQPDTVKHFQAALQKLDAATPRLNELSRGLGDLAQLIGAGETAPSLEGVKAIHLVVTKLVTSVVSPKPKES